MSDDGVRVPPDSTGKIVDCGKLTVNSVDVERQRCVLADDTDALGLVKVTNAQPAAGAYALVTRPIPGAAQPVYFSAPPVALSEIAISFNAAGVNPLINASVGKTIKIWKLLVQVNGNVTVTIKSGGTSLTGPMNWAEGGGLTLARDNDPWFTCGVNEAFNFDCTGAQQVSGRAYYTQD